MSGFDRKANVRPGQTMLVYGASGSVGVYAVQSQAAYLPRTRSQMSELS